MSTYYVEAPDYRYLTHGVDELVPSLFLAGGITGCRDWQAEAMDLLRGQHVAVFNPRRAVFDVTNPHAPQVQIKWEWDHLNAADAILFWFEANQTQPIALYELGARSNTDQAIVVGAHPEYPRRLDVVVQTALARPEVPVLDSLHDTVTFALERLADRFPR